MAVALVLLVLRCPLALACLLAVGFPAAAATGETIILDDLLSFTSIVIPGWNLPPFNPLELAVEKNATAAEGMHLKVEGPAGMNAALTLALSPPESREGQLSLTYVGECASPASAASSVSLSRGLGMLLPLTLTLVVSRRSLMAWLLVAFGVAVGLSSGATMCDTKVTLVVQPKQYAEVITHGQTEFFFDFKHAVCDVSAAAAALGAAAQECGFNSESTNETCTNVLEPLDGCEWNGWCQYPAPPASCSINSEVAQACMHPSLQDDLQHAVGVGSQTSAFIEATFKCVESRTVTTTTSTTTIVMEGRPYSTEHGSLLAPIARGSAQKDGWCSWYTLLDLSVQGSSAAKIAAPTGWDDKIAAEVAWEWMSHGQEEHASIASFSRFSLELLRFAAPPQLLAATHRAAVDEVKHAQIAFGLAALFGKTSRDALGAEVGAFPVETVQLSPNMASMATRTFEEGCKGETTATARLAYAMAEMSIDSPARMPVAELLEDEARHAALAWATVRWALKNGALTDEMLLEVSALPSMHNKDKSHDRSTQPKVSLVWGGKIPRKQGESIGRVVARDWVQPWIQASMKDLNQGLPEVRAGNSPYGEAMARAAAMVRQELDKLEGSSGAVEAAV